MSQRHIERFNASIKYRDQKQLKRVRKLIDGPTSVETVVDGKKILAFCSNDYLGLANHPALKESLIDGIKKLGAGSGASHLISGHNVTHNNFENKFAHIFRNILGECQCLLFSTGYMANLAVITSLTSSLSENQTTTIFSEELNHASLIDGIRLAKQQNNVKVVVYKHKNLEALERLILQDESKLRFIVTDGVFSMDGDLAPVPELVSLAKKYDILVLVDDAHGFGVLGRQGCGILDHYNFDRSDELSECLIYLGTLGKAAGVSGAFVVASPSIVEWIIQKGRSYIYTTAAPPFIAYALTENIDLILAKERRLKLEKNIRYFKRLMRSSLWDLLPSDTAIQPLILGDNDKALLVDEFLLSKGIWVPAIRPPTVPVGASRLRITLSAAHSLEHIDRLVSTLNEFTKY